MSFQPKVYFISTEYLRQNTPIEDAVDDKKILPYITKAEDTYLQEVIGETGYDALKDALITNTLTADDQKFIRNYVQPMVAQYSFYLMFPFLNYKATNKAISKESSEYSQASELDEIKYLRSNILDIAEFYKRRMVKWLLDHPGVFWWYDSPKPLDNLPKSAKSYMNGLYLPWGGSRGNLPVWTEPYGSTYPCGGGGWCNGGAYGGNNYF
jgi:hypothetical protein